MHFVYATVEKIECFVFLWFVHTLKPIIIQRAYNAQDVCPWRQRVTQTSVDHQIFRSQLDILENNILIYRYTTIKSGWVHWDCPKIFLIRDGVAPHDVLFTEVLGSKLGNVVASEDDFASKRLVISEEEWEDWVEDAIAIFIKSLRNLFDKWW